MLNNSNPSLPLPPPAGSHICSAEQFDRMKFDSAPAVTTSFEDLAGDDTDGLKAQRSPLKVLNHQALSRRYDEIAQMLGVHRQWTTKRRYSENGVILAGHQAWTWINGKNIGHPTDSTTPGQIEFASNRHSDFHVPSHQKQTVNTEEAISLIAESARSDGFHFSDLDVLNELHSVYPAAQVEFHPSDVCNEACKGCTYGHDDPRLKPPPINFPFNALFRIAEFQPRALTIAGGGEPLLYRDKGKTFSDLIEKLHSLTPNCRFGLITNGTFYPTGEWMNHFDWIRISIDAATAGTYRAFRGRDYFEKVCRNLIRLLKESSVPKVGVGFVFCADNIHEAPLAARFFRDLVASECPESLERLNIQYRPLRQDLKDFGRVFPQAVTQDQIKTVEREFVELAQDPGIAGFLRGQTNCDVITRGNSHEPKNFARCDYSMIFRLIRANGEVRPCCMRLAEPEFYLGNILSDPPERIALNILYNAGYLRPGCDGLGCKLGALNQLIGQGLADKSSPRLSAEVAGNPFFG